MDASRVTVTLVAATVAVATWLLASATVVHISVAETVKSRILAISAQTLTTYDMRQNQQT